jgi:Putative auto-transporter adhesin, head GIN domain
MKKIQYIAFLTLTFLSFAALADTDEVRNLDKFTKIANSTSGDIYLKQGSPQKVELVGKKDFIASVETEVSGGRLNVRMKNNNHWSWHNDDNFKIYVTVENLDAVDINGSGDLSTQSKFTGTNMALNVNGSGNVMAELELSGQLDANVAGSGDIHLSGKFQNLKSRVSGSGDVELSANVANTAELNVSGSGEISARGKVQALVSQISGSGDLSASEFEADKCTIRVSGSGNAEVYVKNTLEASTSGSGDISYRGSPAQVNTHNTGSGSVSQSM